MADGLIVGYRIKSVKARTIAFPHDLGKPITTAKTTAKANSRMKQMRAVQKVERIMDDSNPQSSVRSIHSMGLVRLCRLALLALPLACEPEAARSRFRGTWPPSSSFTSDFISAISRCMKSTWQKERVSPAIHLQLCQAFLF